MLKEMIQRDYHNPCVLFWGAHNEIDTRTQEALALTEAFVGKIRSLDSSRLVIYATTYPEEDIVLPYFDTGWEPRLFSEDYQADVLEEALTIFLNDPKISGTMIWQFADIRVDLRSERGYFRDRARSFNNKGLVNEYRKPKLAYRKVREIYRRSR